MKAEFLADWIGEAVVDKYRKGNKEVYVATRGNGQLVLICHRVKYPHGLHPHTVLTWTANGKSTLLYQDIVDATYGTTTHSTGEIEGDHTARENLETVWCALVKRADCEDKNCLLKMYEEGVLTGYEVGTRLVDAGVRDFGDCPPEIVERVTKYRADLASGKPMRTACIVA